MDANAAKGTGQQLPELREARLCTDNGVRMRLDVVYHQAALVIGRSTASCLAYEWLEAQLPAGCFRSGESRQVGVPLAERDRGFGTVQAKGRAQLATAGTLQQFQGKIEVAGSSEGFLLPVNRELLGGFGGCLHQLFLSVRICSALPKGPWTS